MSVSYETICKISYFVLFISVYNKLMVEVCNNQKTQSIRNNRKVLRER